jgi:hypothetical protein
MATVFERAELLAQTLTEKYHANWEFARKSGEHFAVEMPRKGQRYFRIVQVGPHQHSVHAFVEIETGKLIKTAGWKGPAKYSNGELASKYNLLDDESFALVLEKCDTHTGYLYAR